MRSFKLILKTVGIFLLSVAVVSGFFIGCYLKGENFHYQDENERAALSGKVDFLLNGASYTLWGIRPDILTEKLGVNAYSLAGTRMSIKGRYELLNQELNRNPVKTVLLEVSSDTLVWAREEEGPEGDLPLLGRITDFGERWHYFVDAFRVSEWPTVYYDLVSKGMESALRLANRTYTTENHITVRGFYDNRNPKKYIPSNYEEIYHTETVSENIDPDNAAGLKKIIALCKEHGATPILMIAPQSKYYNCLYSNLDYFDRWFRDLAAQEGIPYYNFNLAKNKLELLPDDTCYYDDTHLSTYGSVIFTDMLIEVLRNQWQGIDNSSYFYHSYAELSASGD